jgi:hypothetical protein
MVLMQTHDTSLFIQKLGGIFLVRRTMLALSDEDKN